MNVKTFQVKLEETNEDDVLDITGEVQNAIAQSGLKEGSVLVFNKGSTGGITTLEFEPGLVKDLPESLRKIAPKDADYGHEQMWHDGNGHSHVKASLLKPSLEVPFLEGKLLTGSWQQIVFVEFDNKPRQREIVIQVKGV